MTKSTPSVKSTDIIKDMVSESMPNLASKVAFIAAMAGIALLIGLNVFGSTQEDVTPAYIGAVLLFGGLIAYVVALTIGRLRHLH